MVKLSLTILLTYNIMSIARGAKKLSGFKLPGRGVTGLAGGALVVPLVV